MTPDVPAGGRLRVAFFGTPDVAVPPLRAFLDAEDVEVVAVVTNPDRPKGRSRKPVPPPVKVVAEEAGVPVWQPQKAREVLPALSDLAVDACAVVAYGALLPPSVLEAGGAGFVNLHFSLLPRWRGAAPVQHALRAGDAVTGVTTFVLDEGMDTGPVLDRVEVPIADDDTAGTLLDRLAVIGAPVLVDSVRALVQGRRPEPQPTERATLAPKIAPEDVAIDWSAPAAHVRNLVRSAEPAPGAHTTFRGRRLKIRGVEVADGDGRDPPGEVIAVDRDGPVVACGQGAVRLTAVQPAGKGRIDGTAFVNGYHPEAGERLGVDGRE